MTVQLALKLSDELADELDGLVRSGAYESRSQALRAGLEAILADRERRELAERYREALTRMPETAEELADATRLALEAIADEPWQRWW